jgi:hypothetical protein
LAQVLVGEPVSTSRGHAVDEVSRHQAAAAGLRMFMRLSVSERSSVILMDVLGYSAEEIGGITGRSTPAVKAALHRGRERLRAAAQEHDDRPLPALGEPERARFRPTWSASTRATSMPCATCSPRTCDSSP